MPLVAVEVPRFDRRWRPYREHVDESHRANGIATGDVSVVGALVLPGSTLEGDGHTEASRGGLGRRRRGAVATDISAIRFTEMPC